MDNPHGTKPRVVSLKDWNALAEDSVKIRKRVLFRPNKETTTSNPRMVDWPPFLAKESFEEINMDSKDYTDAKMETLTARMESSESRTRELVNSVKADMDQQFTSISASLSMVQKDIVPFWKFATTIIGGLAGAIGIVLGILSFGGDRFDGGWSASSTYVNQVEAQKTLTEKRFDELDEKVSLSEKRFDSLDEKISMIAVSLSSFERGNNQKSEKKNPKEPDTSKGQ